MIDGATSWLGAKLMTSKIRVITETWNQDLGEC